MDGVRYLLDLAILLFTAKLFSILGKKIGIPEVVGEILAGLVVGGAVLGLVKESDFLSQMSEIGVIMLMFEAGLGTNLQELKKSGIKATMVACLGVLVPIVLGALLFMAFYGFGAPGSQQFMKGFFMGTITSATSVSITVAALKELGDVLWYVAEVSAYLDTPMSELAKMNLEKLASRKARGTLVGAGDER